MLKTQRTAEKTHDTHMTPSSVEAMEQSRKRRRMLRACLHWLHLRGFPVPTGLQNSAKGRILFKDLALEKCGCKCFFHAKIEGYIIPARMSTYD